MASLCFDWNVYSYRKISRKLKKATHLPLFFNNNNVSQVNFQTHLGVVLDVKLTFGEHLKNVFNKTNKTIGLLKKLSNLFPRQALVTIYKAFIRPHLDYGDVLYHQAFNNSFHANMESIQYNTFLGITGAIRGTSRENLAKIRPRVPQISSLVQETFSLL